MYKTYNAHSPQYSYRLDAGNCAQKPNSLHHLHLRCMEYYICIQAWTFIPYTDANVACVVEATTSHVGNHTGKHAKRFFLVPHKVPYSHRPKGALWMPQESPWETTRENTRNVQTCCPAALLDAIQKVPITQCKIQKAQALTCK